MSLLVLILVVLVVAILVVLALQKVAATLGGDARLWLLVEALVLLVAAVVILERAGLAR